MDLFKFLLSREVFGSKQLFFFKLQISIFGRPFFKIQNPISDIYIQLFTIN